MPEHPFPIHVAIVEIGGVLQSITRQVAPVRDSGDVCVIWFLTIVPFGGFFDSDRKLFNASVPIGYWGSRWLFTTVKAEPAVALVSRGERVALPQNKVSDYEVVGVLPAHSGRAGDHQLAVPLVGKANHEL